MAFMRLCGRRDERLFEEVVFLHAVWHGNTAKLTLAAFVRAPCVACQVATNDHFHRIGLTLVANSCVSQRNADLPVRHDVFRSIQELGCYLVEHLPLIGYRTWQHDVERRDT